MLCKEIFSKLFSAWLSLGTVSLCLLSTLSRLVLFMPRQQTHANVCTSTLRAGEQVEDYVAGGSPTVLTCSFTLD